MGPFLAPSLFRSPNFFSILKFSACNSAQLQTFRNPRPGCLFEAAAAVAATAQGHTGLSVHRWVGRRCGCGVTKARKANVVCICQGLSFPLRLDSSATSSSVQPSPFPSRDLHPVSLSLSDSDLARILTAPFGWNGKAKLIFYEDASPTKLGTRFAVRNSIVEIEISNRKYHPFFLRSSIATQQVNERHGKPKSLSRSTCMQLSTSLLKVDLALAAAWTTQRKKLFTKRLGPAPPVLMTSFGPKVRTPHPTRPDSSLTRKKVIKEARFTSNLFVHTKSIFAFRGQGNWSRWDPELFKFTQSNLKKPRQTIWSGPWSVMAKLSKSRVRNSLFWCRNVQKNLQPETLKRLQCQVPSSD